MALFLELPGELFNALNEPVHRGPTGPARQYRRCRIQSLLEAEERRLRQWRDVHLVAAAEPATRLVRVIAGPAVGQT